MSTETSASSGSLTLPPAGAGRLLPERLTWLRERSQVWASTRLSARWGWLGLAVLLAGTVVVVAFSTAGGSALVPKSTAIFPGWEAGPAGWLFGHPGLSASATQWAWTGLLLVMFAAYGLTLLAARSLSLRLIVVAAGVFNLILLLSPPLPFTDVFNYLGYARLGALHGLNPYTHVILNESWDPVYLFSSWHNLPSPYGPLFTALTYPLALLPLPLAYWILKVATVAASLGFLWCIYRCARLLGKDPRPALLLVAANPIYLFFAVGAFHNDFFMLLPTTAAIALLLARKDRSAGAVVMLAVAVKFTAVLLLPFLLMAARPPERRIRVLVGVALAAVPLVAMDLLVFGHSLPNLSEQSSVVTSYSIPNLLGLAAGLGGRTPGLMRVLDVVLVGIVLWQLRRRDWIAGAGWATLALIASTSWLMPWYVVWVLPLAALAGGRRLRVAAVVFSLFLVLTFAPGVTQTLSGLGFHPMGSRVGQAALAYQKTLSH